METVKFEFSGGRFAAINIDREELVLRNATSIPEEIIKFTKLQVLRISSSLSGSESLIIPESIGNLSTLVSLSISDMRVEEIPESISNLTNLRSLDLSGTRISELPKSIGKLTNLRSLDLSDTKISECPESIGNLRNLESLNLGYTRINTIPQFIRNLDRLQLLLLEKTAIKELPEWIISLPNLNWLKIDGTNILGVHPHSVAFGNPKAIFRDIAEYKKLQKANAEGTFRIHLGNNPSLNKAFKTAVRQYFSYFEEYLATVKGMEGIEVEVQSSEDEFYLNVKGEQAEAKSEQIIAHLEEFKGLARMNPDNLDLHFEGVHSEFDKKVATVSASSQIRNLQTQLEIANVKIEYLATNLNDMRVVSIKALEQQPLIQINQSNNQQTAIQNTNNIQIAIINNLIADLDAIRKDDLLGEEEKIVAMEQLLDEMPLEREADYERNVRAWLPDYHKCLAPESQQYLVSAAFLLDNLSKAQCGDYSPYLLQLCRVIEGELKQLFSDYRDAFAGKSAADRATLTAFDNQKGGNFFKGLVGMLNNTKKHFMIGDSEEILCKLSPTDAWDWEDNGTIETIAWDNTSPLKSDLQTFVEQQLDATELLEEAYIKELHHIRDRYRNKVAHPGEVFDKEKAKTGRNKIGDWLKHWLEILH